MKRLIAPPLLILALALAVFPVVFTGPGCTTSQQAVAYKTLNIVATSVDAGMRAFADAVVAGKVLPATQAKVRDLHGRYSVSLQAAVLAAHFDTSAPAPDKLKALASELLTLISEALK